MEQVCDLSFHMKFYLRLYDNRIKRYTYRKITEPRKKQLKTEIKSI